MLNLCKALLCLCHVLGSGQAVSELLAYPRLRAHGELTSYCKLASCYTQLGAVNITIS